MTGQPTVVVKLDDGSGTFPLDISSKVELQESLNISSYGRGDEFSQGQASTLNLTLDNTDGSLTTTLGFGLSPFGFGPFGGGAALTPGPKIRVTFTLGATTRDRFTGRIAALDLGWPGGSQSYSQVGVIAADLLADLARRPMRSLLEEEIMLRAPSSYYTLGEAQGSTSVGDSSGNQATPYVFAGTGTAPTFGSGIGPGSDGLTAATFVGGQFLSLPDITGLSPTSYGIGVWFTIAMPPATTQVLRLDSGWSLQMNTAGNVLGTGPFAARAGAANMADGRLHFAAIASSGGLATLYVDGVAADTVAAVTAGGRAGFHTIGGFPGSTTITGTLSHAATWPAGLTAADVLAIYNAGVGSSETTALRFARIAAYAGATVSAPVNSGVLMGAQATSGASILDALMAVAAAEGGVMFANGSGTIVLQGHGYRAQKIVADLTLPNDDVAAGTALTYDTQQVLNQVTVTRTGGAAQLVRDATSIATNGVYDASFDVAVAADSDALSAAQWIVNKHKDPSIRLASASFDLFKSPNAEQIMAREVGDRLALTPLPSQAWSGAGAVTLEGWSETLTPDSWEITGNLLPWSLFQSGIYDDAGSLYDTAVYA